MCNCNFDMNPAGVSLKLLQIKKKLGLSQAVRQRRMLIKRMSRLQSYLLSIRDCSFDCILIELCLSILPFSWALERRRTGEGLKTVFKKLPFYWIMDESEPREEETWSIGYITWEFAWFPSLVPSSACLEPSSLLPPHKRESRLTCSSVSCLNSSKSDGKTEILRSRIFFLPFCVKVFSLGSCKKGLRHCAEW